MWKSKTRGDITMKVVYLYHSGMAFELEHCILIVDYYQPEAVAAVLQPQVRRLLGCGKPVYVLVSHVHADHFDPVVLNWQQEGEVHYVFSADVAPALQGREAQVHFLKKGEVFQDENLTVKAYGSTDVGISFYIQTEGWKLFHAGDLNNWHWNEESTEEEIRQSEQEYQNELTLITQEIKGLDVLCFPVDSRLGHDYMRGAEQFVSAVPVRWFVPIHFTSGRPEDPLAFGPVTRKYGASFWCAAYECDSVILEK